MPDAQKGHESLMRLEVSEVLDVGCQRRTLEKLPRGMLVAGGFRAAERVLDYRPP